MTHFADYFTRQDIRARGQAERSAPTEWALTESQRRARALQEVAMRLGRVAAPPSIFDEERT